MEFPTPFLQAVQKVLQQIEDNLPDQMKEPISLYLAGGVAVHYWTEIRSSYDIDAFLSHKVILPPGLSESYQDENGKRQIVDFDYNYNAHFGLLHPDYDERATILSESDKLKAHVLSPLDLAITKLSRFSSRDSDDIKELIRQKLLDDPDEFAELAKEAMSYYIGNTTMIEKNIEDIEQAIRDGMDTTPSL